MKITHRLKCDLERKGIPPHLSFMQNDSARLLEVSLYENDAPWAVPVGSSVYMAFRTPAGENIRVVTLADGSPVATYTENVLTAHIPPALTAIQGTIPVVLVVLDGSNKQIATFPISVTVVRNPAADAGEANPITPDEFTQLLSAIAVERARITNLSSLKEGSTTGDAELADVRIGYDGTTYASAGEAVRGQIGDVNASINEILVSEESVNLFDKNSPHNKNGYILSNDPVVFVAIAGFTVTHPIKAEPGPYTFHTEAAQLGGNATILTACNESGVISGRKKTATDNGNGTATIVIDENWGDTHFMVNVYNKELDIFMVVKGNTMPSEYHPYFEPYKEFNKALFPDTLVDEDMIKQTLLTASPLYGKKISLNGDSICYGAGSTGGYGKIIADAYNMTLQNIAVSGGTIAAETYTSDGVTARHWICRTVTNMDADADYIILEGGVNDASVKPPLGTMSNGLNAALDDTTFYGAFESMLKQLIVRFAGKKVGYIAAHQVHPDFSAAGEESTSYYYAAKKCCEKFGVPFLDLNISCPPFGLIYPSNTEMYPLREAYTANADGWHPNEEGYLKYYVPKIVSWLETL